MCAFLDLQLRICVIGYVLPVLVLVKQLDSFKSLRHRSHLAVHLKRAKPGEIKPNLWWRYRDDIFYLWTQGPAKLDEFTHCINSLYPTIKFTLVSSPNSLNVLDLTLSLVDGFIQTDIYSKPTDNHIYLPRNSAHPPHVTRAIPYGVASTIRRNCSTEEAFSKRSSEYKGYLSNRGYNPSLVSQQFEKTQSIPRQTLLQLQPKESIISSYEWKIIRLFCCNSSIIIMNIRYSSEK